MFLVTISECCSIFLSYVDNQLRTSKRFDAEGIEREHPELFIPVPSRRTSSTTSLALPSYKDEFNSKETGQLRYWTSAMCSQSPHLFDFVVTVCNPSVYNGYRAHRSRSSEEMAPFSSLHGFSSGSYHLSSHSHWVLSVSSPISTLRTTRLLWILLLTPVYA